MRLEKPIINNGGWTKKYGQNTAETRYKMLVLYGEINDAFGKTHNSQWWLDQNNMVRILRKLDTKCWFYMER